MIAVPGASENKRTICTIENRTPNRNDNRCPEHQTKRRTQWPGNQKHGSSFRRLYWNERRLTLPIRKRHRICLAKPSRLDIYCGITLTFCQVQSPAFRLAVERAALANTDPDELFRKALDRQVAAVHRRVGRTGKRP